MFSRLKAKIWGSGWIGNDIQPLGGLDDILTGGQDDIAALLQRYPRLVRRGRCRG